MKLRHPNLLMPASPDGGLVAPKRSEGGSVLILVLWSGGNELQGDMEEAERKARLRGR